MALVKRAQSDRMVKDAVVLDLGDLGRHAERLLAQAQDEAEAIIAAARTQAQCLIDGAAEKGYAQGREQGLSEGRDTGEQAARTEVLESFRATLDDLNTRWLAAVEQWEGDRGAMMLDAREDVLRLAVEVARRVVHRHVAADGTIVRDQVASALSMLTRPSSLEIRVHPSDRPLVEQVLPTLVERLGTAAHVLLKEDPSVQSGGCIVRTAGGQVDATIQTQLDRIAATLGVNGSGLNGPGTKPATSESPS